MLEGQRLGGLQQSLHHGPVPGLQTTSLGRAQALLGQAEGGQHGERLARPVELLFEPGSQRPQRRSALLRMPHRRKRLREQSPPLRLVLGDAVGADQGKRLCALHAVSVHRGAQVRLGIGVQGAQRVRQRHSDRAPVDPAGNRWRQPLGQRQTHVDPARLLLAQTGDRLRAQPLLVPQRPDHPRLVHGAQRAARAVGHEQGRLPLHRRKRLLDDDGHLLRALALPPLQSLEPVDHLERTVVCSTDTQRKLRKLLLVRVGRPAALAQRLETRAQLLHRNKGHLGYICRGRMSGRCRRESRSHHTPAIWKLGRIRSTTALAPMPVRTPEATSPGGSRPRRGG